MFNWNNSDYINQSFLLQQYQLLFQQYLQLQELNGRLSQQNQILNKRYQSLSLFQGSHSHETKLDHPIQDISPRNVVLSEQTQQHKKVFPTPKQFHFCVYDQCEKHYSSSIALNLHIKLKHEGGTKKQREYYAKLILDAEEAGQTPPQIPITLPPKFLEEYRCVYTYNNKYSV